MSVSTSVSISTSMSIGDIIGVGCSKDKGYSLDFEMAGNECHCLTNSV
jgi:hypothetical protein